MMTTAPACLFYQIITSQFWTFNYLTLARLVNRERYLICEKQANIGQVNATTYLVSLSREITVVNGPEFSLMQFLKATRCPTGRSVLEGLTAHVTTVECPYKELAGRVCMQIQVHENARSIQLRTLLLRRNTLS